MTDKKERLLQSAHALFKAKGYHRTRVSEITESAGMATGSLYHYFESKSMLYKEVMMMAYHSEHQDLFNDIPYDLNPYEIIMRILDAYTSEDASILNFSQRHSNNAKNMSRASDNGENTVSSNTQSNRKVWEWIIQCQESGVIRKDIEPDMIIAIFTALIRLKQWGRNKPKSAAEEAIDLIRDFVVKAMVLS